MVEREPSGELAAILLEIERRATADPVIPLEQRIAKARAMFVEAMDEEWFENALARYLAEASAA